MSTRIFTEAEMKVREYVAHYIQTRHERGETYQAIADDLGVSKTQAQHAERATKVGPKTIDAVAGKEFGGSIDRLRTAADERWTKLGPSIRLAPELLMHRNPELAKAIDYLRGQIKDEFLDGWVAAQGDAGWKGLTRDDFVQIIRGKYLEERKHATSDIAAARALAVGKSGKK